MISSILLLIVILLIQLYLSLNRTLKLIFVAGTALPSSSGMANSNSLTNFIALLSNMSRGWLSITRKSRTSPSLDRSKPNSTNPSTSNRWALLGYISLGALTISMSTTSPEGRVPLTDAAKVGVASRHNSNPINAQTLPRF